MVSEMGVVVLPFWGPPIKMTAFNILSVHYNYRGNVALCMCGDNLWEMTRSLLFISYGLGI